MQVVFKKEVVNLEYMTTSLLIAISYTGYILDTANSFDIVLPPEIESLDEKFFPIAFFQNNLFIYLHLDDIFTGSSHY